MLFQWMFLISVVLAMEKSIAKQIKYEQASLLANNKGELFVLLQVRSVFQWFTF